MRITTSVLLAAVVLGACGGEAEQGVTTESEAVAWELFAATTISAYYAHNPEVAVYAGLHEYDGQMSDFSLTAAEEYAQWIDDIVSAAESYVGLAGIEAFERDYLINILRGEQFWIRDSGFLANNPVYYAYNLDMDTYIDREYAPIEERIDP